MRFKGKKPIFSYTDTFSLDMVLEPIIATGLKKFKEVCQSKEFVGCPNDFLKPYKPQGNREITDEDHNKAVQDWYKCLDKMIYTFDATEPEIPDNVLELIESKRKDGLVECDIVILEKGLYKQHHEDLVEHYKTKQEGLVLFAKYFTSLWW